MENSGVLWERRLLNSNNEMLRWVIWRCNNKHEVKGKKSCANKNIDNRVLYQIFDDVFNVLVENKGK